MAFNSLSITWRKCRGYHSLRKRHLGKPKTIVEKRGDYVSPDSLGLTVYPLYESLDMIPKESLIETQVAYYHKKKRKIAKKLVQTKNAFNERKLYYEQNLNMKGYMDAYKPMIMLYFDSREQNLA